MDKPPTDPDGYQYLGSVIGSLGALLYFWPRTLRGAVIRAVFAILAGSTLYFVPMDMFGWAYYKDRIIGAAVIVAFLSWPLAGAAVKRTTERVRAYTKDD